jgi:hypothetical protein
MPFRWSSARTLKKWGTEKSLPSWPTLAFSPIKTICTGKRPSPHTITTITPSKMHIAQSGIDQRTYELSGVRIPDVSYLVEPLADVWFLAIDANVYIPNEKAATDAENPSNYGNAGDGYSKVLTDKTHLVEWVKKVTADAKNLAKRSLCSATTPW